MILGEVHILPTEITPEVFLNPEGTIKITGRGLAVNRTDIPRQIITWINSYLNHPADVTYVLIALEYLNSFSTTILVSILKKILQVSFQSKKYVIQWYYESDDNDILERGEYISSILNIPIEFIMIDKIDSPNFSQPPAEK
jgi:hypothetical protein